MTIPVGLVATKVEACRCLMVLPNIFNFCWFIVGNVYVFGNWSSYHDEQVTFDCDGLTYMFSFVLLIMFWVVPLLGSLAWLACVCGMGCVGCVALASN